MKHFIFNSLITLSLLAHPVMADTQLFGDAHSAAGIQPYSGEYSYSIHSPIRIETNGFTLVADSGSLMHDLTISATVLPYEKGTAMPSNMENVCLLSDGMQLLPNGEHFSKEAPALVTLAYDPSRIPMGYAPKDIYTYYCDDAKSWHRLERVSVDTIAHTITSRTTHFTDFANAVIKVPEMPESKAFVPTAMTDLPDVDPMHGIPMVEVPTPNNKGTAELTYPIVLPKGRRGMQPNVDLHYSSSGGNGILGVGWSLATPAISIDTRWGVPRYDPQYETEQYLVNGSPILFRNSDGTAMALPYQDNSYQARKRGIVYFSARDTKNQDRIVRIGTNPTNYWWAVTDRNGITTFYGRKFDPENPNDESIDENSVVRTSNRAIAYWAATATIDVYGNYILYTNEKVNHTIYVQQIDYTGNYKEKVLPTYRVQMSYRDRTDPSSSGRLGVLQIENNLLCHLLVQYHHPYKKEPDYTDNLAAYYMQYTDPSEGTLFKSRLAEVVMLDSVHDLILDKTCELEEIIKGQVERNHLSEEWITEAQEDGDMLLAEQILIASRQPYGISVPASTTHFHYANAPSANHLFQPATSIQHSSGRKLSANHSRSWGVGGTVTVGFGVNVALTTLSGGGNYDFSKGKGECKSMLIDMNGDGLQDIVYEQNGAVWYCQQNKEDDSYSYANPVPLPGLTRLSREVTNTHTWGLQLSFGADLSYTNPISTSYTDTYFSDVNADGLPDMIDGSRILINHLTSDGTPSFEVFTGVDHQTISVHNSHCHGIILDGEVDKHLECELREIPVVRYPIQTVFGQMPTYGWEMEEIKDEDMPLPPINYSDDEIETIPHQDEIFAEIEHHIGYTPQIPTPEPPRKAKSANSGIEWNDSLTYRIEGDYVVGYRLEYVCDSIKLDPDIETVRVWAAPHSGVVIITDTIALLHDASISRSYSKTADGVSYIIQHCDSVTQNGNFHLHANNYALLYQGYIDADDTATYSWSGSVTVKQGDLLMFRLRSGENNRFDKTSWKHSLRYENETQIYDSQKDYICTGDNYFHAHNSGNVILTFSGRNDDTESVMLRVRKNNQSAPYALETTLGHGDVNISPLLLSVSANDSLIISLSPDNNSTSEPVWSNIHIIPQLKYISHFQTGNNSTETVQDTVTYYPDVRIVHSSPYQKSSPYRKLFGPMHKGWGAFAYQNINNHDTIILDSLLNVQDYKAHQLSQNSTESQTYHSYNPNISLTGNLDEDALVAQVGNTFSSVGVYDPISKSNFWVPMRADFQTEQWIAYGNMGCIGQCLHSNAREIVLQDTIDEIVEYDTAIPFREGEIRVNNFVRKKSRSIQHSISAGAMVFNNSVSFGSYDVLVDYMDMNGDGYPDFIGTDGIQYSKPWGGIGKLQTVNNFTNVRSKTYASGTAFSACPAQLEKMAGNNLRDGKFHLTASMGASTGQGSSSSKIQFMDINGDGLPDKVDVENNRVYYNIGYGFSGPYIFSGLAMESVNINSSVNGSAPPFSIGQVSISGGIGRSISSNRTNEMLIDINGDGLPDKIKNSGNNGVQVAYNRGLQMFSSWKTLTGIGSISQDETTGLTTTIGATGGFTFLGLIKFDIGIHTSPYSTSETQGQVLLSDMDGDGLTDYVFKDYDNSLISVRYNNAGQANLLQGVENPTGQTISLAYTLSEPTSSHRSRQWNLTSIISELPTHPMLITQTDTIGISYSDSYYDNYEKTDYGYKYVRAEEKGKKINKYVYHNQSFLQNGELIEDSLMDCSGNMYIRRQHGSRYRDVATNAIINVGDTVCNDANIRVLEDGYWTDYYERSTTPQITTRYNIQYDQYHNIIDYSDDGDISTPDDDWRQVITYLNNENNNMISLPKTELVYDKDSQLLRSSSMGYSVHGDPKFINRVDDNLHQISTTHFAYDYLGNLAAVVYPENKQGQYDWSMFYYDTVTYSNIISIDNPHKVRTYTTYNEPWGLPKKIIDPAGNEMRYTYDYKGRLEKVRTPFELNNGKDYTLKYTYSLINHNLVVSDTCKYTHVYKDMYDSLFTQKEVTLYDKLGRIMQKKHYADLNGHNAWIVDGAEEWDAFGRVIEREYPFESHNLPHEYEPLNNMKAVESTSYDILDRPVLHTHADSTTKKFTYEFEKDSLAIKRFATWTTDENGITTMVLKSPQDWLIQQEAGDGGHTFFEYSPIGELLHSTDADGYRTSYTYDMLGQLVSRDHPDAGVTTMEYDLAGNMMHKVTANLNATGDIILYDYDYRRLKGIHYPYHQESDVTIKYDSAGRVAVRQDGAGSEELVYDPMGNVAQSVRRIVVPSEKNAYVFRTMFKYDSFGRMRNIIYPDGEVVHYGYTTGGLLQNVAGLKQGVSHVFLWDRKYDEQGRKKYQLEGNGVWTKYAYNPQRQWLDSMYTELPDHNPIQDIMYHYDHVGNIMEIAQSAHDVFAPGGNIGGPYTNYYDYDQLYRLYQSNSSGFFPYTFFATYSHAGRMGNKLTIAPSWLTDLEYGYDQMRMTHQPRVINDAALGDNMELHWDANGNLAQIIGCKEKTMRLHEWDEENRLRFVLWDKEAGYYGYDGNGERVYKLTGISSIDQINSGVMNAQVIFDNATLYPNPYIVITPQGYTKHYYAGTERLATVIGGGGFSEMRSPIDILTSDDAILTHQFGKYDALDPFLHANILNGPTVNQNISGEQYPELDYACGSATIDRLTILTAQDILYESIDRNSHIRELETEIYYNHSDHLGSANWITDAQGTPIQYIHYAPYGELIANQTPYLYDERFKFTGKERDEESGYDYFSARYLWQIVGHWLSVDPLADKYLWISPYAYAAWNPIKFKDPNGKWVETAWDIANIGMDIASLKSNINDGNIGGAVVDGIGLVLDAGATLVPCIPGGAGTAIKAYRAADKVGDAGKLGKAIDKAITATKNTYRKALQKATGKLGKGYEAHHTLPQKHRSKFEKLGINIDEPGNVVWRRSEGHRSKSAEHTKAWDVFFEKSNTPTREQVMEYRNRIEQDVWGNRCDSPLE